jgi:ubiquinone/menaquinone biosynthesis C-methylase UbiE
MLRKARRYGMNQETRKELVARQFSAAAQDYAEFQLMADGPDLQALMQATELSGEETALDLGCGAGHTALALASRLRYVVAYDLSRAMLHQTLRLARQREIGNVATGIGDAEALPFADSSFDLVTCRLSAHHFSDPQKALGEVSRVLKPRGVFLLVDSISPDLPPDADAFLSEIERLRDPGHVRDYFVEEWETMLSRAGLSPELLGSWAVPIEFQPWVERMRTPPQRIAALESVMDAASPTVRDRFGMGELGSYDFKIPLALIRARA